MLIAVCSDKGSPGVTTAALALASSWGETTVLVEADPYGGDLALQLRTVKGDALAETPTLLTVATAARSGADDRLVARYAQQVNSHVHLVPGFLLAEQGTGIGDWSATARAMTASRYPVVTDLGRLHGGSPMMPIAAAADAVVMVVRPEVSTMVRLRERLNRLVPALGTAGHPPKLFVLAVTKGRHGAGDVADVADLLSDCTASPFLEGVGHLALDPVGVRRLHGGEVPGENRRGRTVLMSSVITVVEQLREIVKGGTTGDRPPRVNGFAALAGRGRV